MEDNCSHSGKCSFNCSKLILPYPSCFPIWVFWEIFPPAILQSGCGKSISEQKNSNASQSGIFQCNLECTTQNLKILTIIADTLTVRAGEEFGDHLLQNSHSLRNKQEPKLPKTRGQGPPDQIAWLGDQRYSTLSPKCFKTQLLGFLKNFLKILTASESRH